jgi:uncharacterized protein DUF4124
VEDDVTKRTLWMVLLLAVAPLASAQLYKYVDKDGKTVYTDQPPPANTKAETVNVPKTFPPPATGVAGGNKSAVERDKELEKGRQLALEKQKKADEAAHKAQLAEERCTQARTAYKQFSDGGRLSKYNEKGERVYLGDAEIEAERERARHEMEEACTKS